MIRKKFNWVDPVTEKKYKDICTTKQLVRLLSKKIETDEQAEDFLEAYSACSSEAEHNIGYLIGLIKNKDVREDCFDLWMVDPQIEPRQLLNKEYRFSAGRLG